MGPGPKGILALEQMPVSLTEFVIIVCFRLMGRLVRPQGQPNIKLQSRRRYQDASYDVTAYALAVKHICADRVRSLARDHINIRNSVLLETHGDMFLG